MKRFKKKKGLFILAEKKERSDVLPDCSTNRVLPFSADFSPASIMHILRATNTRNRRVHAEAHRLAR